MGTTLSRPAAEHSDNYWNTVMDLNFDVRIILALEFGHVQILGEFLVLR